MWDETFTAFCDHLRANHYAEKTVQRRQAYLERFATWCVANGITELRAIDRNHILTYQKHLGTILTREKEPISFDYQNRHIMVLQDVFGYLWEQNKILINPTKGVKLARLGFSLPSQILSVEEAERLFSLADISTPAGLKDRAVMEFFYATGVRRMELCALTLDNIDWESRTVFIRRSKAAKERYIPISERALYWVSEYLKKARPALISANRYRPTERLFLTSAGTNLSESISQTMHNYFQRIGISASCHVFRHTLATLLLENGMDIRYIQEMLGHDNLQTTQIYTRVSIKKLAEVHARTHPLANKNYG